MDWQELFSAPDFTRIRARYADGTETEGEICHDDIEAWWRDLMGNERGEVGREEWPTHWMPLAA